MYYVLYGLLYLISLLPFFILYRVADFIYFILYHVTGYRKEVVMSNLKHAFPEKNAGELKIIAKKFYRNFVDNWIETVKLLSISKAALKKRITSNMDVFYQLHKEGKSAQVNLGHFFNWEIMTLYTGINQPFTFLTVYLPQDSEATTRFFIKMRARWGNPQLSSAEMARAIIPWRKKQYLLALGADQSPAVPNGGYWLNFMHRPAPFLKGPEKFARIQNNPVVMLTTKKPKRGHYHFEYFLLSDDVKKIPDGELIRRYVKHLENNIRLQPEIYLWSHRRWKHDWKNDYADLWVGDDSIPVSKEN